MGTNYYVKGKPPCECCGRPFEDLHIGKSSGGWKFLFAPQEDLGLTSAAAWFKFLEGREIFDEYDAPVTLDEFKALVEAKQKPGQWGADNAPLEAYGIPHDQRHKYEYKDAEGYRFSTSANFS